MLNNYLTLVHKLQAQDQRGAANGIAVTTMSIFKAIAPAAGGAM